MSEKVVVSILEMIEKSVIQKLEVSFDKTVFSN